MSGPWEKYAQGPVTNNDGPWNKYAQPEAPRNEEPGFFGQIDNAVRQLANGVTFGFADKLAAGMSSGKYDDNIKREREQSKKAERDLGMAALPLDIAGGVAGAIATGGGALAARGATMGAKMGLGALEGAGYGALNAAGHTDNGSIGDYAGNMAQGAGMGAALGGAFPVVAKGVGKVVSPLADDMAKMYEQRVANRAVADQYGIPLTAGMETGNKNLQRAESAASQIPFGNMLGGGVEDTLTKLREAISSKFMPQASADLSPSVLEKVKGAMGNEYNQFAAQHALDDTGMGMFNKIIGINNEAQRLGVGDTRERVQNWAREILGKTHGQGGGVLSGDAYQALRKQLREAMQGVEKDSTDYIYLKRLKSAMDEGFENSLPQAAKDAWRDLNNRYSHYKIVENAMGMGRGGAATGELNPLSFAAAVERENGRAANATGKGHYSDLGKLARDVFEGIPDSGTAGRTWMMKLLDGGGLSKAGIGVGAGAGAGAMIGGIPGAAVGAAVPSLIASGLNSKPVQAYLKNQFMTKGREDALRDILLKYGNAGLLSAAY